MSGSEEDHVGMDVEEEASDGDKAEVEEASLSPPVREVAASCGLDSRLVAQLESHSITTFFPIQAKVLPYILSTDDQLLLRDVAVSAPTGSGKTLVYVLSVLQGLRHRRVLRLRALAVLPNRDLASQVYQEFNKYAPAVGLKVGLAIGQNPLKKEQEDYFGLGKIDDAMCQGGLSTVDILVATPGRLIDHLDNTPGFTLQHVRYLIIDEVDRLMNQSYQCWLEEVYSSLYNQKPGALHQGSEGMADFSYHIDAKTVRFHPRRQDSNLPFISSPLPLRKMIFSATLTNNPQKLAQLDLRNPAFFAVMDGNMSKEGKYSTPSTLSEYHITCPSEEKPLILIDLLHDAQYHRPDNVTLIFTSSVDSTHRLSRLLQLFFSTSSGSGGRSRKVREFSSSLSQPQRAELIRQCMGGGSGCHSLIGQYG